MYGFLFMTTGISQSSPLPDPALTRIIDTYSESPKVETKTKAPKAVDKPDSTGLPSGANTRAIAEAQLAMQAADGINTTAESSRTASIQADNSGELIKQLLAQIEKSCANVLSQIGSALSATIVQDGDASGKGQEAITTVIATVISQYQSNPYLADKIKLHEYLKTNLPKAIECYNRGQGDIITKGDINQFHKNIETLLSNKDASELKDNHPFSEFLQGNGKWLLALIPLVAGPLSGILSHIPIIGGTLNAILNELFKSTGSILTGLVMSAFTGKDESPKVAPPETTQNTARQQTNTAAQSAQAA